MSSPAKQTTKRLLMLALLAVGLAASMYEPVLALSQVDRYCINRYCPNYSNEKDACGSGGISGPSNLPSSVPEPFNKIFTAAAAKFNADPLLVASIYYVENRGWREPPPPYGNGRPWAVSSAGALGPMQFLPGTWESHKQDGNVDGRMDVLDLTDAAFGTAHYIVGVGGKAGIPFGNPSDPLAVKPSVVFTFVAYNAGAFAKYPLSDQATEYVRLGVEIYNKMKTGQPTGTTTGGEAAATVCAEGSTTGVGVSPDGFVFPLRTTKEKLKNNPFWSPNCVNKVTVMNGSPGNPARVSPWQGVICHHDYIAQDIAHPPGTPVLSPRPGRIIRTNTGLASTCSNSVSIYSDKALGGDGLTYYLTHLGLRHDVSKSQVVKAGDQVSTVGQVFGGCAFTGAHLHIDGSPSQAGFYRGSRGTEGPLVDIQPALKASYEKLPER